MTKADAQNRSGFLLRVRTLLAERFGEKSAFVDRVRRHRLPFFVLLCVLLSAVSYNFAFVVRFQLSEVDAARLPWQAWFYQGVVPVIAVRVAAFLLFGLHRVTWRYAGVRDVLPIFYAVVLSTAVLVPVLLVMFKGFYPRSVLVMDAIFCFVLMLLARFSYRLVDELLANLGAADQTRVVIVGAGAAGNLTVKAMLTRGLLDLRPVALLDDDPLKLGTTIQGVPVLGTVADVEKVALQTGAQAIVLALPTATTSQFYRVLQHCRRTGLPLKTTPDLAQILGGNDVATRITDFKIEDLLQRRPIRPDLPEIRRFMEGRRVLVTGAAGSIGSELCRQIVEQGPRLLVCVDKDENGLFRLEHDLVELGGQAEIHCFLADIKDYARLGLAFADWRPEVVFHAAAYKHVPILQHHPTEAIANNVGGTLNVVRLAAEHQAGHFVLISTDKAVNPTSVMGATKRIAEMTVRDGLCGGATRHSIIRFGNVLGSAGSVVELFLKQVRSGRPLTVTHPDIERFFMTIPEAVHLVLYSAAMGTGSETFILDMGRPVKIAELAYQIIRLCGLTPEVDVPIRYTGLRPGEKLYEELWTRDENPQPTAHPGILRAPGGEAGGPAMRAEVQRLLAAAVSNDLDACWRSLLALVPSFQGAVNGLAAHPPQAEDSPSRT